MRSAVFVVALTASLIVPHAAAAPLVEVRFVSPDRYSDASPYSRTIDKPARDAVLAELRQHLQSLGAKFLGANDRLTIDVLDVDLAGEIELSRDGQEKRALDERTLPRIQLRYTLDRDATTVTREERVTELGYLFDPNRCRFDGALCREKIMLTVWFERTFAGASAPGSR
jgi:hypothetical protein